MNTYTTQQKPTNVLIIYSISQRKELTKVSHVDYVEMFNLGSIYLEKNDLVYDRENLNTQNGNVSAMWYVK